MSGILCYIVPAVSVAGMLFFGFGAVLINIFDNTNTETAKKIPLRPSRIKKKGVKSVRQ